MTQALGRTTWPILAAWALLAPGATLPARGDDPVGRCMVERTSDWITVTWPSAAGESGRVVLDLRAGQPLFRTVELVGDASKQAEVLLRGGDPATWLVVGSRVNPPPTPPG